MKITDPLIRDLRIPASTEKARTKRIAALLRVPFEGRSAEEVHEGIVRAITDAQLKAAGLDVLIKTLLRAYDSSDEDEGESAANGLEALREWSKR